MKTKDEIQERQRQWIEDNKEHVLEYRRRWYQEHKEKRRAQQRDYYRANKEVLDAKNAVWAKANSDKRRVAAARWRKDNRERCAEYQRQWRLKHPERAREQDRASERKRAGKKSAQAKEWKIIWRIRIVDYLGGACVRCGYKENIAGLVSHHINPADKEFKVSVLTQRSPNRPGNWDKLRKELDKCELLCVLCHDIHHFGMDNFLGEKTNAGA